MMGAAQLPRKERDSVARKYHMGRAALLQQLRAISGEDFCYAVLTRYRTNVPPSADLL